MGKIECPGCGGGVSLTSRVMDAKGDVIQPIIQNHYPLSGNPKGANHMKSCDSSGKDHGQVIRKQKKLAV